MAAELSRQVLLWGEERQELLHSLSAGIIGTTSIAKLAAACLLSLGIGRLVLVSNERADDESMVKTLGDRLEGEYPLSEIVAVHSPPLEEFLYRVIPEVLFDLSGNPDWSWRADRIATRYKRAIYHASSGNAVTFLRGKGISHSGAGLEGMVAALCAEEMRKCAFLLGAERPLRNGEGLRIIPNGYASFPLSVRAIGREHAKVPILPKPARILLAGAGALANFAALHLPAAELDIFDADTIEASNLNRQVLFRGHEGENKAECLAKRINAINPGISAEGHAQILDDDMLDALDSYDMVLSSVDSIPARIALSCFCASRKIPLLNGGTSSLGGVLEWQLPGGAGLECVSGLSSLPAEEAPGCGEAAPSVVMPNAAIGSLMGFYARRLLSGISLRNGIRARYHSYAPMRVYFESCRERCPHT